MAHGWRQSAVWLGALGLAYAAWCRSGRCAPNTPQEAITLRSIGTPGARGNLLGVQPYLVPADFASSARLLARLDTYFAAAAAQGLIFERTIAILPEYLGTWLLLAGEKDGVYIAPTVQQALRLALASNGPAVARWWLASPERHTGFAAAIRLKAARTAAAYTGVLGTLARRYGVHLVGGSVVLPAPRLVDGELWIDPAGPLAHVSALFRPDGRPDPALTRKVYPTAEELAFIQPGTLERLPVYDTPAGRLGILICADAWFPDSYAQLRAQGAELLAVPSFSDRAAGTRWAGYSGWPAPVGVDLNDIGRLTRDAAWLKYGLAGRAPTAGIRAGLNIFYRGQMWQWRAAGQPVTMYEGTVTTLPAEEPVALVNLWL